MPYIKKLRRESLKTVKLNALARNLVGVGDFNFVISYLANELTKLYGLSYGNMSKIRAEINDASDEYYRRMMAPYEDQKIQENGDVYNS